MLQLQLRILVNVAQQVGHGNLLSLGTDIDLDHKVAAALRTSRRILLYDLARLVVAVVHGTHHFDGENILYGLQFVGVLHRVAQNIGHLISLVLAAASAKAGKDHHKYQHDQGHTGRQKSCHLLVFTNIGKYRAAVLVILLFGLTVFDCSRYPLNGKLAGRLFIHTGRQFGADIVQIHSGILAEFFQIHQHGVGTLIALIAVCIHGLHADQLQCRGDIGVDLPGAERYAAEVLDRHGNRAVPFKGQPAGQHLVEYHTGAVDIAAGIQTFALSLLR